MSESTIRTHRVALVLQQCYQHKTRENRRSIIQPSLHLRVDQAARLAELPLGTLVFQEPGHGPVQHTLVDHHVGLSLKEAPQHEGRPPEAPERAWVTNTFEKKVYLLTYQVLPEESLAPKALNDPSSRWYDNCL